MAKLRTPRTPSSNYLRRMAVRDAERIAATGGARPGSGRPPLAGTKPEMKSVKLSREHWDLARRIGEGIMAEGLRRALDAYDIDACDV